VGPGAGALDAGTEFWAEARYPQQVWQLDVPLRQAWFSTDTDVEALRDDFHAAHLDVFAVNDPESEIEIVAWHARVRCRLRDDSPLGVTVLSGEPGIGERAAYVPGAGRRRVPVLRFESMPIGERRRGPALVESSFTTVVITTEATFGRTPAGSLSVTPDHPRGRAPEVGVPSARGASRAG